MKYINNIRAGARRVCRAVREYAAGLWKRLTREPGYADAVAAVVVASVSLLCSNVRLIRFADEVARALAALIRTLVRQQGGPAFPTTIGDTEGSGATWLTEPDWGIEPGWG